MLTNKNRITYSKKNIERKNTTPPRLSGLGGRECAICGFVTEASTQVKSTKTGAWVCLNCYDGPKQK